MNKSNQKIQKLVEIAKMYYEQDLTQSEISKKLNVSRPLISRMLNEAKEYGIVSIQVRSPLEGDDLLLTQLKNIYNIKGGVIVPNGSCENDTNSIIASNLLNYLLNIDVETYHIGVGWGYIIGMLAKTLESSDKNISIEGSISPLIGNSVVSNRDYHSNEIVRIIAEKTNVKPIYIHAPAFFESKQEKEMYEELESLKKIHDAWENINTAIINIGNYPSVPDFATAMRFGDLLSKNAAVGRMLCYYYDTNGSIIKSDTDYAIQIPLSQLSKCRNVIAVGSAQLNPKALVGALRTGLITHLVISEDIAYQALDYK